MAKAQRAIATENAVTVTISEKQRKGRAVNAVAELFMRKLLVPKVYLNPIAFRIDNIDVVAVDRAGSGDIHAASILGPYLVSGAFGKALNALSEKAFNLVIRPSVENRDFHFQYVVVQPKFVDFLSKQNLFAEDGIGRVGIIEIIESPNALPEARIAVPAERFRVAPDKIKKFDNFQKKTAADMEIRG